MRKKRIIFFFFFIIILILFLVCQKHDKIIIENIMIKFHTIKYFLLCANIH